MADSSCPNNKDKMGSVKFLFWTGMCSFSTELAAAQFYTQKCKDFTTVNQAKCKKCNFWTEYVGLNTVLYVSNFYVRIYFEQL